MFEWAVWAEQLESKIGWGQIFIWIKSETSVGLSGVAIECKARLKLFWSPEKSPVEEWVMWQWPRWILINLKLNCYIYLEKTWFFIPFSEVKYDFDKTFTLMAHHHQIFTQVAHQHYFDKTNFYLDCPPTFW